MTEYAVSAAIITIGGTAMVWLFANVLLGVFSQLAVAMKSMSEEPPDKSAVQHTLTEMETEAGVTPSMDNFDQSAPKQ